MLCSICKREITVDAANLGGTLLCQSCADNLAHTAPRLLAAVDAAADLLGRLWTLNEPTMTERSLLTGQLEAVATAARGGAKPAAAWDVAEATDAEEEYWPDTSIGSRLPR